MTGQETNPLPFFTPGSQIWETTCSSVSGFTGTQPPSFIYEASTAAFVLRRECGAVTAETTAPKPSLLVSLQKKFADLVYKENISYVCEEVMDFCRGKVFQVNSVTH